MIQLNGLDHVALRVQNLEASVKWYATVLDLKKYQVKEWGDFPIFMLSGKFGVALFPTRTENPERIGNKDFVKIDHFAFNVDAENFAKAEKRYQALGLKYTIQDHVYFHSIYTRDPDGHMVELTTLVVDEKDFYEM